MKQAGKDDSRIEDFSDRRAFLCRPDDPRLALADWPQHGGFEQACSGPVYVVIGSETDDDRCHQLAERFGLNVDDLIRFRESHSILEVQS